MDDLLDVGLLDAGLLDVGLLDAGLLDVGLLDAGLHPKEQRESQRLLNYMKLPHDYELQEGIAALSP